MAYIEMIAPEAAEGELKEVYDEIASSRGAIADVHRIASLYPKLMRGHLDLYMTLMYGRGGLSRGERELIGTVVSRENRCEYCTVHHSEAYARYERDEAKVAAIVKDPEAAPLTDKERALVAYALRLTREPSAMEGADADALRKAGFADADILAAAAIAGYFNFVNRLVLGLGVDLEPTDERVYKY